MSECTHNCSTCPHKGQCGSQAAEPTEQNLKIANHLSLFNKIYIVLSGKGGVGKSTVATQLAFALKEVHHKQVCLLDCDITGPSLPTMTHTVGAQIFNDADGWAPVILENGLQTLSIGYMLNDIDDPVIMRGPKKHSVICQFLEDCNWDIQMKQLDSDNDDSNKAYLIIDTPPGTSDEHLSIINLIKQCSLLIQPELRPSLEAIIVTTPQEVALSDVRKEINFCKKIELNIKGVVENMSGFVCPCCNTVTDIFSATTGGAANLCQKDNITMLGKIPLDKDLSQACEDGKMWNSQSKGIEMFKQIVQQLL